MYFSRKIEGCFKKDCKVISKRCKRCYKEVSMVCQGSLLLSYEPHFKKMKKKDFWVFFLHEDPSISLGDFPLFVTLYYFENKKKIYFLHPKSYPEIKRYTDFLGHFLKCVFTFSWYATFCWKDTKGFRHLKKCRKAE